METGNGLFMRFGDVSGQKVLPGATGHMLHTGSIVPSQNVYWAMRSYMAALQEPFGGPRRIRRHASIPRQ
jgi:hypothetical protein